MKKYQKRLVDEKQALDEKIVNLTMFIYSPRILGVDPDERGRMIHQLHMMKAYSEVLLDRFLNFN